MNLYIALSILISFLFSALFSGVETGSYMINRIRLRQRERNRIPSALILARLLRNSHIFIFTVLIGNNIAVYLLSKQVTDLYLENGLSSGQVLLGFIPWNAEMAATLTLMFPLFIFAEVAPKNLFRKKADLLMYRLAGLLRLLVWIFYPITWPLRQLFRLLTRNMDEEAGRELHRLSPEGLKEYFSEGAREGVLSSHQSRMMDNATSMHSIPARKLMTPLKKVATLPADATVADFRQIVAQHGTAFVILLDRHIAVGLVSMFALVHRGLGNDAPLQPYAEDVLALPENRNLKSAFYRLRRNPRHSAVVVDVRGHCIGLLQLEDIARYISGE
jgi:CBS domain containing-hemolysin-like protein